MVSNGNLVGICVSLPLLLAVCVPTEAQAQASRTDFLVEVYAEEARVQYLFQLSSGLPMKARATDGAVVFDLAKFPASQPVAIGLYGEYVRDRQLQEIHETFQGTLRWDGKKLLVYAKRIYYVPQLVDAVPQTVSDAWNSTGRSGTAVWSGQTSRPTWEVSEIVSRLYDLRSVGGTEQPVMELIASAPLSEVGDVGTSFGPLRSSACYSFRGSIERFVLYAYYQVDRVFRTLKLTDAVSIASTSSPLPSAGLVSIDATAMVTSGNARTVVSQKP